MSKTIFLRLSPSQCSNPYKRKSKAPSDDDALFFGPPEGIRTPVLQNRNLLRYPTAPQAEINFSLLYTIVKNKATEISV